MRMREVVEFVSRCTAESPLSNYLNQKAAQTGQDVNQLVPRFLKVVRRLIELGFLLPTWPRAEVIRWLVLFTPSHFG